MNEIWEAYCDIEQAIQVSKYVFKIEDELGTRRKLVVSMKNDPLLISSGELSKRFKKATSNIDLALKAFAEERADDEIEFARRARDELKVMLSARKMSERKTIFSSRAKS